MMMMLKLMIMMMVIIITATIRFIKFFVTKKIRTVTVHRHQHHQHGQQQQSQQQLPIQGAEKEVLRRHPFAIRVAHISVAFTDYE